MSNNQTITNSESGNNINIIGLQAKKLSQIQQINKNDIEESYLFGFVNNSNNVIISYNAIKDGFGINKLNDDLNSLDSSFGYFINDYYNNFSYDNSYVYITYDTYSYNCINGHTHKFNKYLLKTELDVNNTYSTSNGFTYNFYLAYTYGCNVNGIYGIYSKDNYKYNKIYTYDYPTNNFSYLTNGLVTYTTFNKLLSEIQNQNKGLLFKDKKHDDFNKFISTYILTNSYLLNIISEENTNDNKYNNDINFIKVAYEPRQIEDIYTYNMFNISVIYSSPKIKNLYNELKLSYTKNVYSDNYAYKGIITHGLFNDAIRGLAESTYVSYNSLYNYAKNSYSYNLGYISRSYDVLYNYTSKSITNLNNNINDVINKKLTWCIMTS